MLKYITEVKIMIKKIALFLTVIMIISTFNLHAFANSGTFSWYCKRTKDHTQPLADNTLEFVTQYGGYYVDKNHGDDCDDRLYRCRKYGRCNYKCNG